ncbi:hypothetical protein AB0X74_13690 [Kurthia gibsonii]|uniref:hypothetical protein n=1 Tax=Kurthia gibsonii TaxID=33946 RepID=UPI0030D2652C
MFDTIKLLVPIMLSIEQVKIIDWARTSTNTIGKNSGITVFKKMYDKAVVGIPTIILTYKQDNPSESWLKVEVSIPKFLYGSNVDEVSESDIDVFYQKLREYLSKQLKINITQIPPLEKCRVDKLHICKNFNVGNLKQGYLKAMTNATKSKYQARIYHATGLNSIESVEWKAQSKKIKLYDKEAEVIAKRLGNKQEYLKAKGMLRFEIELSTADLKQISASKTASEILKKSVADNILQKNLDEIGLGQDIQISSLQQIINTINNQTSLKTRGRATLIAFATDLMMNGEMRCRKTYPKTTFHRNYKNLKTILGVKKIIFSPVTLPPLMIEETEKTVPVLQNRYSH